MSISPLRSVITGAAAGAMGTAAMTAYQTVAAMRNGSSLREAVVPKTPDSWEEAPAPAQVGYRFLQGVFQRDASPQHAPAMANIMHWAYGTGWGAMYGLAAGTRGGGLGSGAGLGTVVWASDYVVLPVMGIYDPPWKYSAKTLAKDWSYHIIYGVAAGLAFRVVVRFDRVGRLPGAVRLFPAQDAALADLTSAVVARWPQLRAALRTGLRPYHLTAACTDDPRVTEEIRAAIAPALPTEMVATEAHVIAADGHRLQILHRRLWGPPGDSTLDWVRSPRTTHGCAARRVP